MQWKARYEQETGRSTVQLRAMRNGDEGWKRMGKGMVYLDSEPNERVLQTLDSITTRWDGAIELGSGQVQSLQWRR